ncbi:MAG: hypothetical protein JRJ24_10710 [Deltaproteobacteria bacterium]|nr:hypothetical protein [Deltaproteobacteria bacterium]
MCFPSKLRAGGFADTWLGAREAILEQRGGDELTALFTGRRLWPRALPGALEEAVDRAAKTLLPTDTRVAFRARVELG